VRVFGKSFEISKRGTGFLHYFIITPTIIQNRYVRPEKQTKMSGQNAQIFECERYQGNSGTSAQYFMFRAEEFYTEL